MNMGQEVFQRMKIIKPCGVSVFRLILLQRLGDLVVFDMKRRTCKIINFAVSGDSMVDEKEKDKIEQLSRSKRGDTEDFECKSEDYIIICGLFRCYS